MGYYNIKYNLTHKYGMFRDKATGRKSYCPYIKTGEHSIRFTKKVFDTADDAITYRMALVERVERLGISLLEI